MRLPVRQRNQMSELIFHHYDFSPFSEKIRLIFGLKGLTWHSVLVPSVMPKPDVVALTGGYRHTPVLQIGADVYCDTRLIAREIDRRYPSKSIFPGNVQGFASVIEAWADRDLFWPIARYVTGMNAEIIDPQFHIDRAALRGKAAPSIAQLRQAARRSLDTVRAEVSRVEEMLGDGRLYLLNEMPGLADFSVYHGLWFLSVFKVDCSDVLSAFPHLTSWMRRINAIGHGIRMALEPKEALAVAAGANPESTRSSILNDSPPCVGTNVSIRPENYHTEDVQGCIVFVDEHEIAVLRQDAKLGEVVVHFPRVGYVIKELR